MAYCTLADLRDAVSQEKLIQLTDDEHLGSVNDARVTKAIESADTLIDSYLRGTHTVPVTTLPGALSRLRQLSTDFTYFFLYKRRRELEMPESLDKDYKRNIDFLLAVQAGKVLLDTPTAAPNVGGIFKTNKDANSRVFTSSTLEGF